MGRRHRQRDRRRWHLHGRKAQVSAIATLFGLMLLVTMISNYLLYQLPQQMTQVEFQHTLQVENQLSSLQSAVYAQAGKPSLLATISSPITLGSQSVPPFGAAATGSVSTELGNTSSLGYPQSQFSISERIAQPVVFGTGTCTSSSCPTTCPSPSQTLSYNVNVSGTSGHTQAVTFTTAATTGACPMSLNVSGSYDAIAIKVGGINGGNLNVVVSGNYDSITVQLTSTCTTAAPTDQFQIFGSYDSYTASGAACGTGTDTLRTTFTGFSGTTCPSDNASATDTYTADSITGTAAQYVTWNNAVGYNAVAHPSGSKPTTTETWVGVTYAACPFTYLETIPIVGSSGIFVSLNNHYSPGAQLALDSGAVVMAVTSASSIMISPPEIGFTYTSTQQVNVAFTVLSFIDNSSAKYPTQAAESGTGTAVVQTTLLSTHSFTLNSSAGTSPALSPLMFTMTTPYPTAWMNYFATVNSTAFPTAPVCLNNTQACQTPPIGTVATIQVPMYVAALTITLATFSVQFR
jgi:hypothetical protein